MLVTRPWFGLYLPQLRMGFDRILERTLAAEAAGFDSIWLMDHFVAPLAPETDTFEGWTIATALAARTSTIRIGHLVLCDPFRHPVVTAKTAATFDVLSNGRLELGLGWGSVPDELRMFGFGPEPAGVRAAKLRETLEIVQLMFAGSPFDYDGVHYSLRNATGRPVPVQAKVPIHIGGGAIVAITSVSGFLTERRMAHYSVSKAALAQLVRSAARELGARGIRVNAVAPGTTDTPMFTATDRLPGYRERVAQRAALGRLGTARDVAQAAVALCTLDWVTGQVVAADGGVALHSPIDPQEGLDHL